MWVYLTLESALEKKEEEKVPDFEWIWMENERKKTFFNFLLRKRFALRLLTAFPCNGEKVKNGEWVALRHQAWSQH